ncbi:MAG TPA: DUF3231 family protein, partial [Bacillota bacterium]|nr:DUF3231 family protein [Bacillota bacterium]
MQTEHYIRLTSAELASLWSTYMNDSMALCMLKHFREKAHDMQIKPIIEYAIELSQRHIQRITEIYKQEKHPIPQAYSDKDVNMQAPSLFGDGFFLHYIKQMSRVGIGALGLALALSARQDIRNFYNECVEEVKELDNRAVNLLLNKGIYVRAPFISIPTRIDFVKKEHFLGHLFGNEQRPILAIEATHLYANIQTNALGKALVTGFSQVAHSQKIREYLVKGREIAGNHIGILSEFLNKSEMKAPMTWDDTVTSSTVPTFSDKFILAHVVAVISIGMADYGAALAISARKDLAVTYSRLITEIGMYASEGVKLMIENEWMEQPPQA